MMKECPYPYLLREPLTESEIRYRDRILKEFKEEIQMPKLSELPKTSRTKTLWDAVEYAIKNTLKRNYPNLHYKKENIMDEVVKGVNCLVIQFTYNEQQWEGFYVLNTIPINLQGDTDVTK